MSGVPLPGPFQEEEEAAFGNTPAEGSSSLVRGRMLFLY